MEKYEKLQGAVTTTDPRDVVKALQEFLQGDMPASQRLALLDLCEVYTKALSGANRAGFALLQGALDAMGVTTHG